MRVVVLPLYRVGLQSERRFVVLEFDRKELFLAPLLAILQEPAAHQGSQRQLDLEEGEHGWIEEKAKAIVLLVRIDPGDLRNPEDRADWSYEGIVAYSKVCTHVGCPVALYEQQTHHLLCPCHQSQFDVANHAAVIFGPAARPLPQLPITVDDEGYLVAQSDFKEPVGPSFWERERN